jgi:hypothetical protein
MGEELFNLLKPFGDWSIRWAKMIAPKEQDRWDAYRKR